MWFQGGGNPVGLLTYPCFGLSGFVIWSGVGAEWISAWSMAGPCQPRNLRHQSSDISFAASVTCEAEVNTIALWNKYL